VDLHALGSSLTVQDSVDTVGLASITSIAWIYRHSVSKELVVKTPSIQRPGHLRG